MNYQDYFKSLAANKGKAFLENVEDLKEEVDGSKELEQKQIVVIDALINSGCMGELPGLIGKEQPEQVEALRNMAVSLLNNYFIPLQESVEALTQYLGALIADVDELDAYKKQGENAETSNEELDFQDGITQVYDEAIAPTLSMKAVKAPDGTLKESEITSDEIKEAAKQSEEKSKKPVNDNPPLESFIITESPAEQQVSAIIDEESLDKTLQPSVSSDDLGKTIVMDKKTLANYDSAFNQLEEPEADNESEEEEEETPKERKAREKKEKKTAKKAAKRKEEKSGKGDHVLNIVLIILFIILLALVGYIVFYLYQIGLLSSLFSFLKK